MYMAPGTSYVYIIYGQYNCLNISSRGGKIKNYLTHSFPIAESIFQKQLKILAQFGSVQVFLRPECDCEVHLFILFYIKDNEYNIILNWQKLVQSLHYKTTLESKLV